MVLFSLLLSYLGPQRYAPPNSFLTRCGAQDTLLQLSDIEEIQRILEDDSDDPASVEDLGEESDIASEDAVEERKLDSETDQEGVGNDEKEEELTSKEEKVVEHIGVKGDAKNSDTILKCWEFLFSTDILELIREREMQRKQTLSQSRHLLFFNQSEIEEWK
ncbi:hypothetical protein RN001_008965 [Aquatica leii]|uniref:Uncharacterized protein n=1 Tax=Aquatica leii TaxID=1421715 RepID=A0AAN7PXY7_9COLE|nr:hypothetical protein RN001_008965 [Aquatica leii]